MSDNFIPDGLIRPFPDACGDILGVCFSISEKSSAPNTESFYPAVSSVWPADGEAEAMAGVKTAGGSLSNIGIGSSRIAASRLESQKGVVLSRGLLGEREI
jgi:hypothetical protein